MYVPQDPSGLKRMLSDLSFFISILNHPYEDGWTPDIIVTASPMFSQCLAQRFLYPLARIPRLIIVQDFVVDAALELGILKTPGIGLPLRHIERWSLRSAQTLTTISEPMLVKLRKIIGSDRRITYIPNWIHSSLQREIDLQLQQNVTRKKKILFYSGNLGVKQGMPMFIEHFSRCNSGWSLQINGGGALREEIQSQAHQNLDISVGVVLSEKDYVTELITSSVCLITQTPGVGDNFLPSKLLPALATGTPVLAVCDPKSPLGLEVNRGGFGAVVGFNSFDINKTLQKWARNPEELTVLSKNAFEYSKNYSRIIILKQYEAELKTLYRNNIKS
jgi:colanic acid biosynthesis glycosyl transferase WcaI